MESPSSGTVNLLHWTVGRLEEKPETRQLNEENQLVVSRKEQTELHSTTVLILGLSWKACLWPPAPKIIHYYFQYIYLT